jgi:polar amino acid transport system substrate-binding protein
MTRTLLGWLLYGLALCCALPCFAFDLYLTEVAPFAYPLAEKRGYDGINVRIAQELVRRSGVPLELKVVPSARHIVSFRAAQDAYSISQYDNLKDEDGPLLAEATRYPVLAVTLPGQTLASYEDLRALSLQKGVGVLRRLSYGPVGPDERLRKVEINTVENGLRMLAAGRVSAVVASQPALMAAAERLGMAEQLGPTLVITYSAQVLRARPASAATPAARLLADTLRAMQKDGTVARIAAEFKVKLQPEGSPASQ